MRPARVTRHCLAELRGFEPWLGDLRDRQREREEQNRGREKYECCVRWGWTEVGMALRCSGKLGRQGGVLTSRREGVKLGKRVSDTVWEDGRRAGGRYGAYVDGCEDETVEDLRCATTVSWGEGRFHTSHS